MAIRGLRLGAEPLWRDESLVYWLSHEPLRRLVSRELALTGIHPPLFYLLHFLWAKLLTIAAIPRSEIPLRVPSVILGAATVPIFYAFGRRFFDVRVATAAAILMALSGAHIAWSQDAKPEILLTFLCVINLYATFALAEAVAQRRPIGVAAAVYALSLIALLYGHSTGFCGIAISGTVYAALIVPAQGERRRALAIYVALTAAAIIAFAPWAELLMEIARNRTGYYWLDPVTPAEAARKLMRAYGFADLPNKYPFLGLAIVGVMAVGVVRGLTGPAERRAVAAALIVFPIFLFVINLKIGIFREQVLTTYPLPLALLAYGFAVDWAFTVARPAGAGLAALLLAASIISDRSVILRSKEPWDRVTAYLDANRAATEPILLWPGYAEWSIRYYTQHGAQGWASVDLSDGRREFRPFNAVPVVSIDGIPDWLHDADRVWLIEDTQEIGDFAAIDEKLRARYPSVEEKSFYLGLMVKSYTKAP